MSRLEKWKINRRYQNETEVPILFSIKDVVAIGVEQPSLSIASVANPCTWHRIRRAFSCNIPLQAFSVVFGPIVISFNRGLIGHAIKDAMSGGLGGLGSFQVVCLDFCWFLPQTNR